MIENFNPIKMNLKEIAIYIYIYIYYTSTIVQVVFLIHIIEEKYYIKHL